MRLLVFPIVAFLCMASIAAAQTTGPNHYGGTAQPDDEIARIVGYAMTRGGASVFLEARTHTIGGRITGRPQSRAAAELILKTLKEAGLQNGHLEKSEPS